MSTTYNKDAKTEPLLKLTPAPGELTVQCPKCLQRVSETCCAHQDFDYYKDCYCWITRADAAIQQLATTKED